MKFDFNQVHDRRSSSNINKWTIHPPGVLPLWLADMDFRSPEPVRAAIQRRLEQGILGYELAGLPLLNAVANRLERLYGWQVSPDMLVPVPGVNIGCRVAATIANQPGSGMLVQPPVFYEIYNLAEKFGLHRHTAPLHLASQGRTLLYELDLPAFTRSFHQAGVQTQSFLLCNPHNPLGRLFTPHELAGMARACIENNALIISDDIHSELLLEDSRFTPLASLDPAFAERSITLIGPGKAFNLAGLGCAFAVVPQPELRAAYQAELERLDLNPNILGLAAAAAVYAGECDEWLAELLVYLRANRDFLLDFLHSELPALRYTRPAATYLAWIDCQAYQQAGLIPGSPAEFFLEQTGVALSDGAHFGPGAGGFVRLNFACPRSILEQALLRMRQALTR